MEDKKSYQQRTEEQQESARKRVLELVEEKRKQEMFLDYPYDPDKYPNAPAYEKAVVTTYNAQWAKLLFWVPEIRNNYRYLEEASLIDTHHGQVLVQAGGIVPTDKKLVTSKINGALGGTRIGAQLDEMISLRPVSRRIGGSSNPRRSAQRFVCIRLGKGARRASQYVPYGWIVYLLRHTTFNGVFPMSYEPMDASIMSYEEPAINALVTMDEIDKVLDYPRGMEIHAEALKHFNEVLALGGDPKETVIKLPASPREFVHSDKIRYNTWFPENLRPTLIQPTFAYENRSREFELFLTNPNKPHYDNDFRHELRFFGLDEHNTTDDMG